MRTPGSPTSTSSAALEVDDLVAIYTYDDLAGPLAEPLPLLIPHPTLTHGRTAHALARDEVNHVGEAIAMVIARDRYLAEDAAERIVVELRAAARGSGYRSRPGRQHPRPRRRPGQCRGPHGAGERRCRGRDRCGTTPARRSTCRLNDRRRRRWNRGACWPDGIPSPAGCGCGRRPRPPPGCARPSRPSCSSTSPTSRSSPRTSAAGSASRSMHPWPEEVLVAFGRARPSTGR